MLFPTFVVRLIMVLQIKQVKENFNFFLFIIIKQ